MALHGTLATVRAQAPQTPRFATALAYVEEILRAGSEAHTRLQGVERGKSHKVELAGGVFAIEQVYDTRPRAEGFFESHRKHIDVQVIVDGEELIEVVDAAHIQVREAYNPERDLITYHDSETASHLKLLGGDVAVFFPVDVHMPTLRLRDRPVLVRKTVVKIPVD
jgi:biofilm protein TabA